MNRKLEGGEEGRGERGRMKNMERRETAGMPRVRRRRREVEERERTPE